MEPGARIELAFRAYHALVLPLNYPGVKNIMNLQETIKSYYWITADSRRLKLNEMTTLHLGNTLKMLWNHVCHRYKGQQVEPMGGVYGRFTDMAADEPQKMLDLCLILRHVIDRREDVYTLDPWYPKIVVQLADGRPKQRHEQLLSGAQTRFKPICEFYASVRRSFYNDLDFSIGGTNGLDLDDDEEDERDWPFNEVR